MNGQRLGPAPLLGLSPEAFLGKRRPSSQEAAAEATDETGVFMLRGVCVHVRERARACEGGWGQRQASA